MVIEYTLKCHCNHKLAPSSSFFIPITRTPTEQNIETDGVNERLRVTEERGRVRLVSKSRTGIEWFEWAPKKAEEERRARASIRENCYFYY